MKEKLRMSENINKKKILIVGSESGLAPTIISEIQNRGDDLITVSRVDDFKKDAFHYNVDLSNTEESNQFCDSISGEKIDVFLYLAGIFQPKSCIHSDLNIIEEEMNVNLISPMVISNHVLVNMIKQGNGTMIFIGSSSSYQGFKNTSTYCASKHGILGYARSIADEVRDKNIKVTCICPGSINTKMSIPLQSQQDPSTFIDPKEVSKLIISCIYHPPITMWQEEIILKRRRYF